MFSRYNGAPTALFMKNYGATRKYND